MARQKKNNYRIPPPTFGEWLRQLREAKGVPLRVVAAAAEMDQAHLSKVELGQRLPTAEQVSALGHFFGVKQEEIEARRIAEKFRLEHAENPAAAKALQFLNDGPLFSEKK